MEKVFLLRKIRLFDLNAHLEHLLGAKRRGNFNSEQRASLFAMHLESGMGQNVVQLKVSSTKRISSGLEGSGSF